MEVLSYKDILNGIEDVDVNSSTIKGYASVFGNVDSDGDVITRGAYAKTIQEWGPAGKNRIKMCWQHDIWDPIAKTIEMYEDEKGLAFVAQAPKDVPYINDRIKMIEAGVIDELSVGFRIIKREDGRDGVRKITEVKLYEYSLVTLAANDMARVTSVKGESMQTFVERLQAKSTNIMKMLRKGELTDETYHDLEYYHTQLIKHISDLMEPSKDTPFEPSDEDTQVTKSLQELKDLLSWN